MVQAHDQFHMQNSGSIDKALFTQTQFQIYMGLHIFRDQISTRIQSVLHFWYCYVCLDVLQIVSWDLDTIIPCSPVIFIEHRET